MQELFLPDEAATLALGVKISRYLRPGMVLALSGELGAGKTTLVRGIVQGLGGDPGEVHSPTFSLVHVYECERGLVNHCDFYRLGENSRLEEMGGLEFFSEPKIYLVEWMERCALLDQLPPKSLFRLALRHDSSGRSIALPKSWNILD